MTKKEANQFLHAFLLFGKEVEKIGASFLSKGIINLQGALWQPWRLDTGFPMA
jgi:hypothetical protein